MFTSEDGAYTVIIEAIDKYEKHFNKEFPIYEYIHITKDEKYDFSVKGAKRLSNFIDGFIKANKPVSIPSDYKKRLY